jgi:hypothetical protein
VAEVVEEAQVLRVVPRALNHAGHRAPPALPPPPPPPPPPQPPPRGLGGGRAPRGGAGGEIRAPSSPYAPHAPAVRPAILAAGGSHEDERGPRTCLGVPSIMLLSRSPSARTCCVWVIFGEVGRGLGRTDKNCLLLLRKAGWVKHPMGC